MNLFPATYRLTYRYKPNFSYMDEWEEVLDSSGQPKVCRILSRRNSERDDYWGWSSTLRIKMPPGLSDYLAMKIMSDHLAVGGCEHEYDCCGCDSAFGHSFKRIGKDEWIALQSHSLNY